MAGHAAVIYPQRRRRAPPGSRAGPSPPPPCSSGCACGTTVFFRARTRTTGGDGDVMPELPFPPDLDQLRRQARELLRAAAQGEPDSLARLHAVSDRVVLSAAQLAVAREYGFGSWPALKTAVERDRSIDLSAKPPAPTAVGPDLL